MDKGGVVQDFIHSLEQLSNPIMLFKVNCLFSFFLLLTFPFILHPPFKESTGWRLPQLTPQLQEAVQPRTDWWWCWGAVGSFYWWWSPPLGCSARVLFSFLLQGLCPVPCSVFLNRSKSYRITAWGHLYVFWLLVFFCLFPALCWAFLSAFWVHHPKDSHLVLDTTPGPIGAFLLCTRHYGSEHNYVTLLHRNIFSGNGMKGKYFHSALIALLLVKRHIDY